ncbi:MAG: beta-galactosidase, partial [Giesbergeria sp.]|nr:beta-galactosidase [Giesbergeria sp.]
MTKNIYSYLAPAWALAALLASGPLAAAQAAPFVIAPMIEGQGYCKAGLVQPKLGLAIAHCAQRKDSGVKELAAALNKLEPGGAKGAVQVGYTIGINLLEHPKEGEFNPFGFLTQALQQIDRPAVIYLFANHFAGSHAYPPIQADSMARFADQSVPTEKYFQRAIAPITLDLQAPISVNQQRSSALNKVGQWYASLPPKSRSKIIAFTLAGELHHFYDDFSTGMGRFDNIRITDYSPASVRGFQGWLRPRYGDVAALNKALGANFKDFSQVVPPSKNIHSDRLTHFSEHFDSYAHGVLPIEGWLQHLAPGEQIRIYLNGVAVGQAQYGLNRQDVYEALPGVTTAQLGFRYLLDFSQLPRGKYTIQVVLEGAKNYELAQRSLSVMGRSQEPIQDLGKKITASAPPKSLQFYLDHPAQEMAVFYNPLARDWLDFRSAQVTQAY